MMKLAFDHEDLRVYQAAIEFVAWLEGVASDRVPGTQTPYSYTYSYTRISSDTDEDRKRQ